MSRIVVKNKVCPVCGKVHKETYEHELSSMSTEQDISDWEKTKYYKVCDSCKQYKEAFELCSKCGRVDGYRRGLYGPAVSRAFGCDICSKENSQDPYLIVENNLCNIIKLSLSDDCISLQDQELCKGILARHREARIKQEQSEIELQNLYDNAPSYKLELSMK